MGCLVYLRFTVRVPASSRKHHPPVLKPNIIYHCKLIIGNRLLKRPEEIICRSHKQRTVLNRIFFISAQWRVGIFLCDAVKPFNESLYPGWYRPEIQWWGKDDTVRLFYFGDNIVKCVFLHTWFPIPAGITAKTPFNFILYQRNGLNRMPAFFRPPLQNGWQAVPYSLLACRLPVPLELSSLLFLQIDII